MYATKCIVQGGDKLRLQNFGVTVFNDLKTFCNRQRECTKIAMEGKKTRTPTRFNDIILESILGRPFQDVIDEKIKLAIEEYKKEHENAENN